MTSKSVEVMDPYLDGNYPPMIGQNQYFVWEPTGADWIGISLKYYPSWSDNTTYETMTCMVEDTEILSLMVPCFHSGILKTYRTLFQSLCRASIHFTPTTTLTARIAGEHVMFASGYTF